MLSLYIEVFSVFYFRKNKKMCHNVTLMYDIIVM